MPNDGREALSRRGQQRWSADRQVVELARQVGELGLRPDLYATGGLVIHDRQGGCKHPDAPCTCEGGPLRITPEPPRRV